MKQFYLLHFSVAVLFATCSCSEIKNHELYKITDSFVDSLETYYDHYGMFGGDMVFTSNGEFKVMPTGRLINVRIERVASDDEYQRLCDEFKSHYSNDSRVNDVYICGYGTIMIDCRR